MFIVLFGTHGPQQKRGVFMTKQTGQRQPAHVELVDRLQRACAQIIRPFSPDADFEGTIRAARSERVLFITDLITSIIIPPNAIADVRRRIEAIRDSLNTNEQAKRDFGNEIVITVSDLDRLLDCLPREADVPATT